MGSARDYAYLQGRLGSLFAFLPSGEWLDALIEQGEEQQARVLTQLGLATLVVERTIADVDLEQALISRLVDEALRLIRPLSGKARGLLTHWMRRFELINLKLILRGKQTGIPVQQVREQLVDIGPLAALPLEDLLQADDVAEALRHLARSPYGEVGVRAERVFAEKRELFDVEASLDRDYFVGLTQRVNGLPQGDRQSLRPVVGRLIDQINLVWLLRYRFAAGLSPPYTYFLLIPSAYRLSSQRLMELARLESLEQVVAALPPPLDQQATGSRTVREVEAALEVETEAVAYHVLRRTVFNLGQALAYLHLREKQMLRIHVALKGRRLRLDPQLLRDAAGMTS